MLIKYPNCFTIAGTIHSNRGYGSGKRRDLPKVVIGNRSTTLVQSPFFNSYECIMSTWNGVFGGRSKGWKKLTKPSVYHVILISMNRLYVIL